MLRAPLRMEVSNGYFHDWYFVFDIDDGFYRGDCVVDLESAEVSDVFFVFARFSGVSDR